ncbi:hypothetical protein LH991_02035 [Schleiferilactobacillus harbinensis]|nr:GyrI-like domain-containing protein [Schleiferilactobacillus harbinensis]MBO3091245.1 hypothetical protein [Schleiferilactobacillus harbinensis]QFR62853.1 hypothetical protein LH991_02035 [Schleiferilactobacillus harbinensis]HAY53973.1 hypothetical protein [Lactobacillus sp.]
MAQFDYRIDEQTEYNLGDTPSLVMLTERNYLMFQGTGEAQLANPEFKDAAAAMYAFAAGIKEQARHSKLIDWFRDYVPYPLSVYRTPHGAYTMLIKQPNFTVPELLTAAQAAAGPLTAAARQVAYRRTEEGVEVQLLQKGPVTEASSVFTTLTDFMQAHGMTRAQDGYRTVYLDNILTTPADQVRTLVRIPVTVRDPDAGDYEIARN